MSAQTLHVVLAILVGVLTASVAVVFLQMES
jgi:hypothetical protein